MKKRVVILILTTFMLSIAVDAFCQDPGMQDSLAFGNPDGSPMQVFVDHEIRVPVYIKCDENISFMHLCLATENEFITERSYFVLADAIIGWPAYGTLPVDGWPETGLTSQSLVAIADYSLPEPEFINTDGEWVMVGEFIMQTTDNPDAMGQVSDLLAGEHPVEGVTVLFDELFSPIVPGMKFSQLDFLDASPPEFIAPSPDTLINVNCHYEFAFVVEVMDVDNDELEIMVDFPYEDYELDEIINEPGHAQYMFSWTPPADCDTMVTATFTATDENDLTTNLPVDINVEPIKIIVDADTTIYGYPASVNVYMELSGSNSNVGAFDLNLEWDINAFHLVDVIFGNDFDQWEYLNFTVDPYGPGTLILLGLANIDNGNIPPVRQGNYHVATIYFQTEGNPDLQGMAAEIDMPTDNMTYNVLTDSTGYLVYHPDIQEGYIFFMNVGDVLIGDINLNLMPYETGDVVVFVDHLVNPIENPFNAVQRIASDCNQDMIPATVADLVYMLNIINGGGLAQSQIVEGETPEIEFIKNSSEVTLSLKNDIPVGGMRLVLSHDGIDIENIAVADGYKHSLNHTSELISIVIYPEQVNGILSGDILTLDINDGNISNISIIDSEFSTPDGAMIR